MNLYEAGLLLARLLGAVNLIVGIGALVTALAVAVIGIATHTADSAIASGLIGYLMDYGTAAFVAGIAVLVASKWIARFASRP